MAACAAAAVLAEGDPPGLVPDPFGPGRGDDEKPRARTWRDLDLLREAQDAHLPPARSGAAGLDLGATQAIVRAAAQFERACPRHGCRRCARRRSRARYRAPFGIPGSRREAGAPRGARMGLRRRSAEIAESSVVRQAKWLVALEAEERSDGRSRGGVVSVYGERD